MSSCCKAISFSSMFSTEVTCEARMTEAMLPLSVINSTALKCAMKMRYMVDTEDDDHIV